MAATVNHKTSKSNSSFIDLLILFFFVTFICGAAYVFDLFGPLETFFQSITIWGIKELFLATIALGVAMGVLLVRNFLELRHQHILRKKAELVLAGQKKVLELIAGDRSLEEVLNQLVNLIEAHETGALCSVKLFDPQKGKFLTVAAPNLSRDILTAIECIEMGPHIPISNKPGYRPRSVFVPDIGSDPLWNNYRNLASSFNLKAYWGVPVISSSGILLGSLEMFFHETKKPAVSSIQLIEIATSICSIAIVHNQAALAQREPDQLLTTLLKQNNELQAELISDHFRMQALSHQIVKAQETQRTHIARELHDEIGQALTALSINLQILQNDVDRTDWESYLNESISLTENTLHQVRDLSLDLRPSLLDDLGLVAALRWYINRLAQRTGLSIQFSTNLTDDELSNDLITTCYRIVQEALTNVTRHAHATKVNINLDLYYNELSLIIADNGIGFGLQEVLENCSNGQSSGLISMQERAALLNGNIQFETKIGKGSKIIAFFPLTGVAA